MNAPAQHLSPSEASSALGISIKALRLYEEYGLLQPARTLSGWRVYGPAQIARARSIVALRRLGMSLRQIEKVLDGDAETAREALAVHRDSLERELEKLAGAHSAIGAVSDRLDKDTMHAADAIGDVVTHEPELSLHLPWPWAGERFEIAQILPLTYIVGPLGSGKTRLAGSIASALGAEFVGMDRLEKQPELSSSDVNTAMAWLVREGASASPALGALVAALSTGASAYVIDYIEAELDSASQTALGLWLRQRGKAAPPIFLTTRSTAILDLEATGRDQCLVYCPANHAPAHVVLPYQGAPGFEALSLCLATPQVWARTKGMHVVVSGTGAR
ncbi:hypothetical protein GCM10007989_37350 [Devosia pacifica]|uniref:HTH merR-type domain-containing protein n=1 Tax=Devosia pacifica TaxID=1335967 RepID=A0A918SFB2_9HYPH|nr:MerR family transcriptional regulator [Devosia pacifica]GHA37974.1 hypothetical protein GCM10007989_37350 [Devosia pacifica]